MLRWFCEVMESLDAASMSQESDEMYSCFWILQFSKINLYQKLNSLLCFKYVENTVVKNLALVGIKLIT